MMVSHTRHAKHVNVLYINNEYIYTYPEGTRRKEYSDKELTIRGKNF